VAILVLGESRDMSGEASSRASIELPGAQPRLAQAVQATGVPVVVVLMNGRPLALSWLHDHVPAIVEAWYGGVEAGNATADVLFGAYDPGGKLPVTFPRSVGQVPVYASHENTGRPPNADNRYTSRYLDLPWTPLYPFGHGLSYTTFSLSAPRPSASVLRSGGALDVAVDVANTGSVGGDEVVQLYVRDDVASVARPVAELRGFERVHLAPGERRTVHFAIGEQALAFYDTSMTRVVEPGTFTVWVNSDTAHAGRFRFETADGRPVPEPERCGGLPSASPSAGTRAPAPSIGTGAGMRNEE
jgi:beta-glucosidase